MTGQREAVTAPPTPSGAAPRGSLLRTELSRLTARRFIRILVTLALLGFVVLSVVLFTQFSRPTPDLLAAAETRRAEDVALSEQFRQQCLNDDLIPADEREFACGPPLDAESFPLAQYLDREPFVLAEALPGGALGVAAATAMLGFVIGATYIGAEWSTRSIVALLFWETRRLKVIGVKTGVAALGGAALGVLGQLAWLGVSLPIARTRGTTEVAAGFWGDYAGQAGRSVLLVVVVTLLGFGLANLIRNTGAALGIGFAYFAIVETALRNLFPRTQPFLLTDNSLALVQEGGLTVFIPGRTLDAATGGFVEFTEIVVSNLRGGLTLSAYLLVLLGLGTWLFRRRDLH